MVKKLTLLFLGMLLFGALLLAAWYRVDGIPIEESKKYLSGAGYTSVKEDDGSLIFLPENSNRQGLLIMHGALIKPQSYAKSAAFFAHSGYTVYLPNGPGRLSIAVTNKAAERMQEFDVDGWFFIGHSMGGMASLEIISDHKVSALGVALWATAMPTDYSRMDVPVLFIWGDADGLLPEKRFQLAQKNLPDDVRYVTLSGANHKNFAMYSHQFFDGEAKIDWMEQIDFANETTAAFFASKFAQPVNEISNPR
jgi:pimeloyl-ACP methyl ester carboxylesterase